MRTRVWSSLAVVIVGLVPALFGGPVFALFLVLVCAAGYREYLALAARLVVGNASSRTAGWGYVAIPLLALAAFRPADQILFIIAIAVSIFLTLASAVGATSTPGAALGWSLVSSGALYLGLPVYAAVALREIPGTLTASWLTETASRFAVGWTSSPRGLAWVLVVIFATWVGDSSAYLGGRWFGRHKLAPLISPNKTVEGAIAGFAGSIFVAIVWFAATGLGSAWEAAIIGVIIAASGQAGDLAESMLKRQAEVKDSGSLIPGHGGILDRIDALLFAFPASYRVVAGAASIAR